MEASVTASPISTTVTAISDSAAVISSFLREIDCGTDDAVAVDAVVAVDVFQ